MKNLENYGVQELNAREIRETEGGWIGIAIGLVGLAIYLYDNRDQFVEGFSNGYEDAQNVL